MYDSATPTALALRAYERATLTAQARRARLNQNFGLNADGTMNGDTSGSIYQGNLDSVNQMEGSELADRRRGFAGTGGLGHKNEARAYEGGMARQSGMLRDAFGQLADTRQEEQDATYQHEDALTQIKANSDNDLAATLAANPISVPPSAPDPSNSVAALPPALVAARAAAQRAALKKNPYAAQVARNNRY